MLLLVDPLLNTVNTTDAFGRPAAPLELLILGALRVLGRRSTFDDLYEATFISAEVHRVFFHKFVSFYAKNVYPIVCRPPETEAEIRSCTTDYEVHDAIAFIYYHLPCLLECLH
jgi:hypothetical protein